MTHVLSLQTLDSATAEIEIASSVSWGCHGSDASSLSIRCSEPE